MMLQSSVRKIKPYFLQMYDLGNKLAPALQLGEEYTKSLPPPTPKAALSSPEEAARKVGSRLSTVTESTEDSSSDKASSAGGERAADEDGSGLRKLSQSVILDKTTPVL